VTTLEFPSNLRAEKSIFAACRGADQIRPLRATPWIATGTQHVVSTRKLVASRREQLVLEDLLDRVKPALPLHAADAHPDLKAPFRYATLPRGSRFSAAYERGLWYGSLTRRAALAELAYARALFLGGSSAAITALRLDVALSAFRVVARRGIDLTRPPFDRYSASLSARATYQEAQDVGIAMRTAGVEAFRFTSARDARSGGKIGVFHSGVFPENAPRSTDDFHMVVTPGEVEVFRRDPTSTERFVFTAGEFAADGRWTAPGI
jgi:hypothetical protein